MIGRTLLVILLHVIGALFSRSGVAAQSPVPIDVVTTPGSLEVTLEIPAPELLRAGGGDELSIPDFGRFAQPGEPELPGRIFSLALPPGAQVTDVTISALETIELPGRYDIPPAAIPVLPGERAGDLAPGAAVAYRRNHERSYGSDEAFPRTAGRFVGTAGYRRYDLVDVLVSATA